MRRSITTTLRLGATLAAGVWLAVAAFSPQPAWAQQFEMWAAVAISPSTGDTAQVHADAEKDNTIVSAIHSCSLRGQQDCKVVAVVADECVALAVPSKFVVNLYGYGTDPTREGAAAQALAQCVKAGGADCVLVEAPCAYDNPRPTTPLPLAPPRNPPLPVDSGLVSIWQANVPGGIWLWQIAANGTYTFYSEASDNAQSHNGSFTAAGGKYTLHSYSMAWDDQGTYTIQPGGNSVEFSGKLGTGTWTRTTNNPFSPPPASPPKGPVPGVNIRK
jgi:hypothetical protein